MTDDILKTLKNRQAELSSAMTDAEQYRGLAATADIIAANAQREAQRWREKAEEALHRARDIGTEIAKLTTEEIPE